MTCPKDHHQHLKGRQMLSTVQQKLQTCCLVLWGSPGCRTCESCVTVLMCQVPAQLGLGCDRSAVCLLPGEVGELSISRDGCCASLLQPGVPVPHRMERNAVAASAPAAYSPSERGFASKINGATLAKLILHCSPVSCGSSVWV